MSKDLPFPSFRRALRKTEGAAEAIPPATFYRYARGEVPATLEWLLRYPDLLRALAEDSESMSEAEWKAWRRAVTKRAKAAKDRRAAQGAED